MYKFKPRYKPSISKEKEIRNKKHQQHQKEERNKIIKNCYLLNFDSKNQIVSILVMHIGPYTITWYSQINMLILIYRIKDRRNIYHVYEKNT